MASALGPVHVQGCEKQGKSRRRVQRGIWCWSWCTSGLCPQPASLHHHEALSREFRTGCPWELLYAGDLMISAVYGGTAGKVEDMEIRDGEERLACERREDKDYGVWHEFEPIEEIWKGPLWCLSDRSW